MPTPSELAEIIPITEIVEIIPPAKQYKPFQTTWLQVLDTITIPEIAAILNEIKIGVVTLETARRLVKCPNIILAGFNSDDHAPAQDAVG